MPPHYLIVRVGKFELREQRSGIFTSKEERFNNFAIEFERKFAKHAAVRFIRTNKVMNVNTEIFGELSTGVGELQRDVSIFPNVSVGERRNMIFHTNAHVRKTRDVKSKKDFHINNFSYIIDDVMINIKITNVK